jgi:hypothetical protein
VTPDDLLSGPRGRRTCWELRDVPELTERAVLDALARSVDDAVYWQEPHEQDLALRGTQARAALLPIAQALCESPALAWWSRPLALDDQHQVVFEDLPAPALTGIGERIADSFATAPRGEVPLGADWRTCSAFWWSAPITLPSVVTTRSLGDFGPARLWLVEDSMGWTTATAWRVTVANPPRVYEVATPADWVELVRRYPYDVSLAKRGDWWRTTGRDGRWSMPDWPAVCADYEAVHVTVLAYLTCAGDALAVDDDTATVLAGWDPDATYWLADVVEYADTPVHWFRDEDELNWHR